MSSTPQVTETHRALARSIEIWIRQDGVHPDFIANQLAQLTAENAAEIERLTERVAVRTDTAAYNGDAERVVMDLRACEKVRGQYLSRVEAAESLVAEKDKALAELCLCLIHGKDPREGASPLITPSSPLGKARVALALTPADMGTELARLRTIERDYKETWALTGPVLTDALVSAVAHIVTERDTLRARVAELERCLDHAQQSSRTHQDAVCKAEARAERMTKALEPIRDTAIAMCDALRSYPDKRTVICVEGPRRIKDTANTALYDGFVPEPRFLIYAAANSKRSDYAIWWRPNAAGYTIDLTQAGRYTQAEALRQTEDSRGDTVALPEHEVLGLTTWRVLDINALRSHLRKSAIGQHSTTPGNTQPKGGPH